MTPEHLAEIQQRAIGGGLAAMYATDVSDLLAEVKRLTVERDAWKRTADARSTVQAAAALADLRHRIEALADEIDGIPLDQHFIHIRYTIPSDDLRALLDHDTTTNGDK